MILGTVVFFRPDMLQVVGQHHVINLAECFSFCICVASATQRKVHIDEYRLPSTDDTTVLIQ